VAAQGAVALVAGALLLALPTPGVRTVGIIVGVALLLSAAAEVVEFTRHHDREQRTDRLIAAAVLAGAGAVLLAWPTISELALLYVVGVSAVVFGFAEAAAVSTRLGSARERWLGALLGIVAFVFGIAMLAQPGNGFSAVINVFGAYLVVIGALRLLQALDASHRRRRAASA
jgi:uncharacterized membrane protein HdeD (DUF308 family)